MHLSHCKKYVLGFCLIKKIEEKLALAARIYNVLRASGEGSC